MNSSLLYSRGRTFFALSICLLVLASLWEYFPFSSHKIKLSYPRQWRGDSSSPLSSIDPDLVVDLHKRESHPNSIGFHALNPRADFTCGPNRRCENGACCGASGFCGFGPTYCGDGCTSNCNATAPCGKYAAQPGTTCPLNTCCSQYGFCGTTPEFCDAKCQSNCILHPKPPASGGQVLDRVIGYYESWSARLSCHKTAPTDLPLDALTHLNYAFAYIDPKSFTLTTMDSQTPESLFHEVADLKKYNSRLEVWISVGGWTFSDNNTLTQPVFGNIARSSENRKTFANNVLKFLNQYGYDGIDIDWEYPGAPDRGGKDDDTKNYVELLKELRATFDNSGRRLGISFTAPSSYWYLRWFDLPNMLKYSDWINVMTYDLHGTWDRNNPIGNIVQGHTYLTEIGYALELFWRVKIPPHKVFMGFGFYGRSFQLQDSSCSKPGCPFKGGAAAGPCSDTSGILMYYEIMNLLKQHPELKQVYDRDAAVKYLVFNNDQWVSYDDAETFKQKKEWANNIGLGGSLIWASDADDDKYSAHKGLIGKDIKHVDVQSEQQKKLTKNRQAVTNNLIGQNGQDCRVVDKCLPEDGSKGSGCFVSEVLRGWEKSKCGKGQQRPICCPTDTAPKENGCRWRGTVSECNGQCHTGETLVFKSSWGGLPAEKGGDTRQCTHGVKAFCCDAGDWKKITELCHWTKCGESCSSDLEEVSTRNQKADFGCKGDHKARYCCQKPTVLKDCVWRTGAAFDCANAKCNSNEVQVDSHPSGSGKFQCSWGRLQVNCCKTVAPPPPNPFKCDTNLCQLDPDICRARKKEENNDLMRRNSEGIDEEDSKILEKRGGGFFAFKLENILLPFRRRARWPSRGQLYGSDYRRRNVLPIFIRTRNREDCPDTTIEGVPVNPNAPASQLPATLETEHAVDRQLLPFTIRAMNLGYMRNPDTGETVRLSRGAIDTEVLHRVLFTESLPVGVGGVGNNEPNRDIREPIERIIQALGNNRNPDDFIPTEDQINGMKGQLMGFDMPMANNRFRDLAEEAASGLRPEAATRIFATFNTVIAVFEYLQHPEVALRRRRVEDAIQQEFARAEALDPAMYGAPVTFMTIQFRYNRWVEEFAQNWMASYIEAFENEIYRQEPENAAQMLKILAAFKGRIKDMTIPQRTTSP